MEEILGIGALVLALALLYWAIVYWYVTLPLLAIGVWIYLNVRKENRAAKLQAEQTALRQRHSEEQEGYRNQMANLGKLSLGLVEPMPTHLTNAERWLDKAEAEFADGAFAPFWDSVEKAAYTLAWIDKDVRQTKDNSSEYIKLLGKCEENRPQFPLEREAISKLGQSTTATAERMRTIVRKGQRDFQFATIFEQRKTNQILIAGFTNLGQALDQMSHQISSSIASLTGSLDHLKELVPAVEAIHEQLASDSEMRRKHDGNVEEMLDNIQRRRKPLPAKFRDGQY